MPPARPGRCGRLAVLLLVLVGASSLGCGGCGGSKTSDSSGAPSSATPSTRGAARGTLGPGQVARAGDVVIPASLVGAAAARESLPPTAALDALIADALLAEGAKSEGLDTRRDIQGELVAARAQETVKALRDRDIAAGPPTDAEVEELTALHWREVDVPEQVQVIHAVALRPEHPDAASLARAKAVGSALAQATAGSISKEDFEARARAVPHEGVEVRIEELPNFVEDGCMVGHEGTMDSDFSHGAFTVGAGGTTQVIESSFGWHVIHVLERLPPVRTSLEERRRAFTVEARAMRGRKGIDTLLAGLHARLRIEVNPAAEAILRDVKLP